MFLIIVAWLYWFTICLFIGHGTLYTLSRIVRAPVLFNGNIFYQFWFGLAMLIGILQILSLFFPLSGGAFIGVGLLALFSAIISYRRIFTQVRNYFAGANTHHPVLAAAGIIILLLFVSYCANKEVTHTDTFIYHYQAVKWAKEYPAVPGLVNLHGRLAFNSSFFLFAALTDIGIYADHSAHIALSLLMLVCLIQWFGVIISRRSLVVTRIFCMLTLVYIIIHISLKMDIASLATDYPMAVVTLVFCLVLLDKIDHKLLLMLPLSALAFTIKLSGMPMVAASLIAMAGYIYYLKFGYSGTPIRQQAIRLSTVSFALLCLISAGFIIRNVILSGWLLYPFPVGNLHLPWSTPKPYVTDMIAWIKSYPKIPGGASPETISGNDFFFWFNQWFARFSQSTEFFLFFGGLAALLWAGFQQRSFWKFIYPRMNIFLLITFSIISILFWFVSAPDVRFGSVYFFIFFASVVVLLYEATKYKDALKVLIYAGFVYQVVHLTPAYLLDRPPSLFTLAYTQQPKVGKVVASPAGEDPPLYIYMPVEGNLCGNAPVPCTPYAGGLLHIHQQIRQRVPGDLSKGFLAPNH